MISIPFVGSGKSPRCNRGRANPKTINPKTVNETDHLHAPLRRRGTLPNPFNAPIEGTVTAGNGPRRPNHHPATATNNNPTNTHGCKNSNDSNGAGKNFITRAILL